MAARTLTCELMTAMHRCRWLFAISLAVLPTRSVHAQSMRGLRAGLTNQVITNPVRSRIAIRDSTARSQWVAGMAVGGFVGVVLGALLSRAAHDIGDDPNAGLNVRTVLISGFAFAALGGMIGSTIHER
jgi:hypothetical protein